ncbi:hypothetical protein RD792_009435 [Penstemon davidsonii]|uniref:FLZ-type domain-containing protein n=1 Tax=Penstemon davidsonii TaxID=160366 RepID=A0ABR0CZ11_9LAMI|nr:hypothetical protein RD792_009435 [Penstemon davidsonii]
MLRNKSGAVASKQALMADQSSLISPSSPISSFLNSPRFFNVFFSKKAETNSMSPTSILDTKNSSFINPFGYETNQPKPPTQFHKINDNSSKSEPQAIGLALIDSLIEEKTEANNKVLFGSKLNVQIPITNPQSDFGIKTPNSQLLSPFSGTKDFKRQLSLKEMELSEDYTCVISHGPNPKTTHIFDNCIVESCSDDDDTKFSENKKIECDFEINVSDFLSFCHTCKDSLGQGKDIYMYRGEKAFCSQECRGQEMLFEMRNQESDDAI